MHTDPNDDLIRALANELNLSADGLKWTSWKWKVSVDIVDIIVTTWLRMDDQYLIFSNNLQTYPRIHPLVPGPLIFDINYPELLHQMQDYKQTVEKEAYRAVCEQSYLYGHGLIGVFDAGHMMDAGSVYSNLMRDRLLNFYKDGRLLDVTYQNKCAEIMISIP